MIVTIFRDIYEKKNPFYRPVETVLKLIKDGKYANRIHQLRNTTEKAERERIKKSLVSICFCGKFTERFDDKITHHSGLAILDFDHVKDLPKLKEEICKDEYTFAAFVSPSGDGLKVLVKIPADIKNHEAHYIGLMNKYPDLDSTSKNLSRVCFVSYDKDLYHNPNSKVFTEKGEIKVTTERRVIEAQRTDYAKINIAADMIRNSVDGEKHHNLIRAARLIGGFVAGGMVEEHEAVRVLENEINQKDIGNFTAACKTIQDGIEYGKKAPIYEETYRQRVQEIKHEEIIIKDEPAKDLVLLNEVRDKIIYTYEHGTSRGETTHFHDIDEVFRHKRGEITLMHGIGNHGKSQLLMQFLLAKAVKDNYRYGVFSPENMPVEEFYKDLMHSYVGRSTEKHHFNRMSMEELEKAMTFVNDHFFLIYPEKDDPTPEYINHRFRELLIKHSIDGCVIDPYNQLDNDISKTGGREDQYLSIFLTKAKKFAVTHNLFYYIVSHPKGNLKKDGVDYECPNVFDLSGGAMWNNKCDNILVTHRPHYTSDKTSSEVHFKSQKIKKQKLNGIPGDVSLSFDKMTSRYYQLDGFNPMGEKKSVPDIDEDIEMPF